MLISDNKKNVSPKSNKRLVYLDLLRVISVLGVIIIHVSAKGIHGFTADTFVWKASNVYDSLSRFCVPVFVMISGSMLLDPNRHYSIKKLYKNKILRMATAFVFWSIIYMLYYILTSEFASVSSMIYHILLRTATGNYHLWFLFMISGLYMITPILRKIVTEKRITRYYIFLSFGFGCAILFVKELLLHLQGINALLNLLYEVICSITNSAHLEFLLGYVFYYVLGYYLKEYGVTKKAAKIIYSTGIVSSFVIIIGTYFVFTFSLEPTEFLYNYTYLPVFLSSIAVYVFFNRVVSKNKFKEKTVEIISVLSKFSFGIYLVHVLVLDVLYSLGFRVDSFNTAFCVPIMSVLIFAISFVITVLIGKIPVLKKYVI